jgi:hypothetical protein
VLQQAVLRRAVVIRTDGDDARELEPPEPIERLDHLACGIAADANEHGYAVGRGFKGRRHDRILFLIIERRSLARSPERKQASNAACQVVLDEAPVARQVDSPIFERRDQRDPDSRDHGGLHRSFFRSPSTTAMQSFSIYNCSNRRIYHT